MLQVDLVRHRAEAGLVWEKVYQSFYYVFESVVNFYIMRLWYCN